MAVLTIQSAPTNGLVKTMAPASAGGDQFPNDGNTSLFVKNGGGSSITVTINSIATCNFGFDHDVVVTLAAGAEICFPKFDPNRFNDSNWNVNVTYSAVTSVTVAAVRLSN